MAGVGLTNKVNVEVISAYAAGARDVPAVEEAPGWFVVGDFYIPLAVEDVRLEVIGSVSHDGLTMQVRLFDLTDVAPIVGSTADITETTDVRATSGLVSLGGGRTYQIQAQVVGSDPDEPEDQFGVFRTATMI